MGLFNTLDISASGLSAERLRMDLIAGNLANVDTTRTASGGPFRRQLAVFQARDYYTERAPGLQLPNAGGGVRVLKIVEDQSPLKQVYDPSHPDADADGYVFYPNVNPILELADLITASRAYEANLSCLETGKQMIMKALTIGR
jgi:flagellar basal-body rod protein FlgC